MCSAEAVAVDERIRVFLLTESRLLGEALARILKKRGEFNVVAASCLAPESCAEIAAARPDVLLADTTLIRAGEIQLLPELKRILPKLKILLVGMDCDKELFLRAVKAGIGGYLLKDASASDVASAIRSVACNEAVCPPLLCLVLFQQIAQEGERGVEGGSLVLQAHHPLGLTRREQQLVEMIGRGLTNKEIASLLNLSEQTIKNHVHRMLRKVGASDRLSVVELCRGEELSA